MSGSTTSSAEHRRIVGGDQGTSGPFRVESATPSEGSKNMRIPLLALMALFAAGLASPGLQQEKGGEDETGPYEVVARWPTPWAKQGYIWGSQPGVFAQSPDRIFIVARGELKLP